MQLALGFNADREGDRRSRISTKPDGFKADRLDGHVPAIDMDDNEMVLIAPGGNVALGHFLTNAGGAEFPPRACDDELHVAGGLIVL